ncbi:MAG TPA: HAMP domain-containing sensor histidine kinase [Polyangia bacterium]|jgi:signal transduction histidine kinase
MSPPDQEDDPTALFGAAAHEIKNALGPLAMTLQLAERSLLAGLAIPPADMAFARAQVRRLSRLVEDLMDLTRADLGQLAIRPRHVDLVAVVSETVEVFCRGHAAPVAVELPPEGTLPISIDETRVHQVLLNLLENAARYSPDGAPIGVAVSAPAPAVARVTVRDRGPGIDPAEQARIFERFVRGAAAEGKGGLGIGLYLCRTIMERHGGAIGVDSTVGDGAAFWIDLPR